MTSPAPKQAPGRSRTAGHWLCVALVLLIGMTQQLVLCEHEDGGTYIEFAHVEGASHHHGHHHGGCDHVHFTWDDHADGDDHGGDDDCDDPHSSCEHVHLSVDVGPEPAPDVVDVPGAEHVATWPPQPLPARSAAVADAARPPPATGPPRPRPFLALRASTVLLI